MEKQEFLNRDHLSMSMSLNQAACPGISFQAGSINLIKKSIEIKRK